MSSLPSYTALNDPHTYCDADTQIVRMKGSGEQIGWIGEGYDMEQMPINSSVSFGGVEMKQAGQYRLYLSSENTGHIIFASSPEAVVDKSLIAFKQSGLRPLRTLRQEGAEMGFKEIWCLKPETEALVNSLASKATQDKRRPTPQDMSTSLGIVKQTIFGRQQQTSTPRSNDLPHSSSTILKSLRSMQTPLGDASTYKASKTSHNEQKTTDSDHVTQSNKSKPTSDQQTFNDVLADLCNRYPDLSLDKETKDYQIKGHRVGLVGEWSKASMANLSSRRTPDRENVRFTEPENDRLFLFTDHPGVVVLGPSGYLCTHLEGPPYAPQSAEKLQHEATKLGFESICEAEDTRSNSDLAQIGMSSEEDALDKQILPQLLLLVGDGGTYGDGSMTIVDQDVHLIAERPALKGGKTSRCYSSMTHYDQYFTGNSSISANGGNRRKWPISELELEQELPAGYKTILKQSQVHAFHVQEKAQAKARAAIADGGSFGNESVD